MCDCDSPPRRSPRPVTPPRRRPLPCDTPRPRPCERPCERPRRCRSPSPCGRRRCEPLCPRPCNDLYYGSGYYADQFWYGWDPYNFNSRFNSYWGYRNWNLDLSYQLYPGYGKYWSWNPQLCQFYLL